MSSIWDEKPRLRKCEADGHHAGNGSIPVVRSRSARMAANDLNRPVADATTNFGCFLPSACSSDGPDYLL